MTNLISKWTPDHDNSQETALIDSRRATAAVPKPSLHRHQDPRPGNPLSKTSLFQGEAMKSPINHRILTCAAALLFAASAIVNAQPNKGYDQVKAEHPGWTQIPGRLMRPDCVHQVPSGAQIEFGSDGQPTGNVKTKGKVIAHYDSCPEQSIDTRHLDSQAGHSPNPSGYGNGWVEASQWELSLGSQDNIAQLINYWYVPAPPAEDGALVFMFNGIEPSGTEGILQPVLQYGDNGNFGGDYYTFASWLVGSGYAFYSTPYVVSPGDYLFGNTAQDGVNGDGVSYYVSAGDTTMHQESVLTLTNAPLHWVWAFAGVLEAYNVTSCSQYPSPLGGGPEETHFRQTRIGHNYPNTEDYKTQKFYGAEYDYFGSGGPQCNFSVSISGTTSLLTY